MYNIYMTLGILLLIFSILFITLGRFGKISPEPFKNIKQFYAFHTIFFIAGIYALINAQGVDCQIERYKSNLEKMSFDIAKASIDCKIIGYDDIDKCPLMWEHNKKKNSYKEELSRLLKEKYGR